MVLLDFVQHLANLAGCLKEDATNLSNHSHSRRRNSRLPFFWVKFGQKIFNLHFWSNFGQKSQYFVNIKNLIFLLHLKKFFRPRIDRKNFFQHKNISVFLRFKKIINTFLFHQKCPKFIIFTAFKIFS